LPVEHAEIGGRWWNNPSIVWDTKPPQEAAFGGTLFVDKLGWLADIASDFNFLIGAVGRDQPIGISLSPRRLA